MIEKRNALWNVLYSGTNGMKDHDIRKRIALGINIMCLAVIGINATIGVLSYLITRGNLILIGISIENALAIIPILLNRYLKFQAAALVFFFIISCATGYFSCILGKSVESQLMIIYLIGLSIFLFARLIAQIIAISYSIGMIMFVEYNFAYNLVKPIEADTGTQFFMRWAVYGVVIFLVIITFSLYKKNAKIFLLRSIKTETDFRNEAKKNKIKDQFISNVSHELKVSFHSIFSIINILYKIAKQNRAEVKLKQPIDDLRTACKISEGIIENVIEYERYEAGLNNVVNYQLVDIRTLISRLIEIFKYQAEERKVEIEQKIGQEIPQYILCDETITRHIITNLLHNAIKFTRSGTNIIIRAQMKCQTLILSVEDKGEGIAQENLESIFHPFVTQNPHGLGLGLYIVKKLVTAVNGKVEITQNSDFGVHFTLYIPLPVFTQNDTRQVVD